MRYRDERLSCTNNLCASLSTKIPSNNSNAQCSARVFPLLLILKVPRPSRIFDKHPELSHILPTLSQPVSRILNSIICTRKALGRNLETLKGDNISIITSLMASLDFQKSTQIPSPVQRYNEDQDEPRTSPPTSLEAPISPPPTRSAKRRKTHEGEPAPNLAAIEAGETAIDDHLAVISEQLSRHIRPMNIGPRDVLRIDEFRGLYARNQRRDGRHFVVHQHDHPVAGMSFNLALPFHIIKIKPIFG